jgi:hypothetical protein
MSVPGEYEYPSSKSIRTLPMGPVTQNDDFLETCFNDFDYMSVICGGKAIPATGREGL